MSQKSFVNILVIIGILIIVGAVGYFVTNRQIPLPTPVPLPTPIQISDVEHTKPPPPTDEEARTQCIAKGGEWYGHELGRGRLAGCITATNDGGKLCHDSSECQSFCLADWTLGSTSGFKGRCYGKSDYRGCGIILMGESEVQCID